MLRWRLLLGALLIGGLAVLAWLDQRAAPPGVYLLPVALVLALLAGDEMLGIVNRADMRPSLPVVYAGNLLLPLAAWLPFVWRSEGDALSLTALGFVSAVAGALVLAAFVAEMRRYRQPGSSTLNLAGSVLILIYVGLMLGLLVQIRMLWGVGALLTLVIVVKAGDIGAYTIGRLVGRHKLTPVLSPGKTIEGAFGHFAFAWLGAWAAFTWILPQGTTVEPGWWRWTIFGLLLGLAGMLGDLAESLLKRDVGLKDSSRWMPGFGGVLDLVDSLLLAAPVGWLCFAVLTQ